MKLYLGQNPSITVGKCPNCKQAYVQMTNEIYLDFTREEIYCVVFQEFHAHRTEKSAYVDATFGKFETDNEPGHITFTAQYSETDDGMAWGLLKSPRVSEFLGKRLSRTEALKHPKITAFWDIIDFISLNDPTFHWYTEHYLPGNAIKTKLQMRGLKRLYRNT
jgi:hypothetical protein